MPETTLEWAEALATEGTRFCLGVIVAKSGSSPQGPGAKGLFLQDGRVIGTLGGGCLEMEVRSLALDALRDGKTVYREFKLDDDFGWDDGLICGGRVQVFLHPEPGKYIEAIHQANHARKTGVEGALVYDLYGGEIRWETSDGVTKALETGREVLEDGVFIEPFVPRSRLIIFGAGHIGAALCAMAAKCEFDVTVVDDRTGYANGERLPDATEILVDLPEVAAQKLTIDARTFLCLVTRGHRGDAKVLREAIHSPAAFLGMIGSRRKVEVVKREFLAEGICTEEQFARVRSPMGLDLGAESVTEICVSILAELIQVRAALRGPILARCGSKPLPEGNRAVGSE